MIIIIYSSKYWNEISIIINVVVGVCGWRCGVNNNYIKNKKKKKEWMRAYDDDDDDERRQVETEY